MTRRTTDATFRRLLSALVLVGVAVAASGQSVAPDPAASQTDTEGLAVTQPPEVDYEAASGGPSADAGSERIQRTIDQTGALMAQTGPAGEELSGQDDIADLGMANFFLKWLFALCVVLGLMALTYWLLRRMGRRPALFGGLPQGQVAGRCYLTPRASLHFVRTGGRVLVVGVGSNDISLLTEFDEAEFDAAQARAAAAAEAIETRESAAAQPPRAGSFLALLQRANESWREQHAAKHEPRPTAGHSAAVDDIAALRGDIQRLQRFLKESGGGERNG